MAVFSVPSSSGGRRPEALLFNGDRVSVWEEKVLEMEGGAGCITACQYLMPLNCTCKNV